jgi:hypothetical protein
VKLGLTIAILVAVLGTDVRDASAQSYPTKPIRIIVPYAAGGAVDVVARLVGARLADSLGQPVIVENRAGAGGNAGADAVAKSPPDGYTILQNTNGQAISAALYRALPFDTVKDFIPVTQLVATYTVLVANPKLPAKSVQDLIALAKAKPGALNYGMTGVGNSLHLTMEMFKRAAGIDIQAIPYRGDALLNPALIARGRRGDRADRDGGAANRGRSAARARRQQRNTLGRAPQRSDRGGGRHSGLRGRRLAGLFRLRQDAARRGRGDPAGGRESACGARSASAAQGDGQRASRLDTGGVCGEIRGRLGEVC